MPSLSSRLRAGLAAATVMAAALSVPALAGGCAGRPGCRSKQEQKAGCCAAGKKSGCCAAGKKAGCCAAGKKSGCCAAGKKAGCCAAGKKSGCCAAK